MKIKNTVKASIIVSTVLMMSGCSLFQPSIVKHEGWVDWDGRGGWSETSSGGEMLAAEGAGPALGSPGDEVGAADTLFAEEPKSYQNAPLRAGSVDDNAEWDDYLLYRLQFHDWGIPVHDLDVSGRHTIKVVDHRHLPVLGARVDVFNPSGERVFQATTGADGTVYFHPQINGGSTSGLFVAVATKGGSEVQTALSSEAYEHQLELDARTSTAPVRLDIHFLIDATGSMSDEIQQLKDNMISVAEQIAALQTSPDVRYGMTIYRDRGDLFISRTHDFTPDVATFTEALREVQAEGGGDYPESLNEGLHQAIFLPEWRVEETVSLLFLIADAPPHLDYVQDYDYAQDVFEAVGSGIKIFPLASSGLDDQGEYIFRQLAQITGGKFLFLTYGPGGAPGDDTTHHVDDYSVLSLDDLIVRLVEEQLAFLSDPGQ